MFSAPELLPVLLMRFAPTGYNFGVTPWGDRIRRWNNDWYSAYVSWGAFTNGGDDAHAN